MYNILIIEDEIKAAKSLKKAIHAFDPGINVLAILDSVEGTLNYFNTNDKIIPDLIFSDIKLVDGESFEIFDKATIKCPVIFCTAYEEFAIKAFDANAIGYILKPFSQTQIDAILTKYKKITQNDLQKLNDFFKNLTGIKQDTKTLLINYKEKYIPVKTSAIAYFYFNEGKTYAFHLDRLNRLNQRLEDLETQLDTNGFFRANRQFIVNRDYILDFENYFSRKLILNLKVTTNEKIIISKEKAGPFIKWVEG